MKKLSTLAVLGFAWALLSQTWAATPLRVGYVPVLSHLPLIVSHANDRLNLPDTDLSVARYNSFTALEAALRVGTVDVANLPVPIVLSMAADNVRVRIIGICSAGGSRLVARAAADLSGLKGQSVGVPGLDSNEALTLERVLKEKELRMGLDYKALGVSFSTVIDDFVQNRLDALYLPEPFPALIEARGQATAVGGQEGLTGKAACVLAVSPSVLSNKQAMGFFLTSLTRSCAFIEKDIADLGGRQTAIIQAGYFRYPEDTVMKILSGRLGGISFKLSAPDKAAVKAYMDQAVATNLLHRTLDLDRLVDTRLTGHLAADDGQAVQRKKDEP